MNEHRKSGFIYLAVGIVISGLEILFFQWLSKVGLTATMLGAAWGLPGALAMIGATKAVTGAPFSETNKKWNSMPQWKQTVLGFLLLFLGVGFIALAIATIIYFSK